MFLCFLQKQEKPKFVLCVTFAENGDAITGDSSGNILVWGKGALIYYSLQTKSALRVKNHTIGKALNHKNLVFCVWAAHRSRCLLDNPPSTKHATFTSDRMNPFIHLIRLCHTTHTGTNRISHVIQGAHESSIFALCMLRNGTLVSGGKDRRLLSWDGSYQQIQAVEVRKGAAGSTVWFTGEGGKIPNRDMIPTIPS